MNSPSRVVRGAIYAPRLCRAFTLVEILMVIVIMGIAAAIILPQVGSRDDVRTAAAARALMADLAYAQSRAVSLQKTQYVKFEVVNNLYQVLDQLSPAQVITHPVDRSPFMISVGDAANGELSSVILASASFDSKTVLGFDEMGVPLGVDAATGAATALSGGSITLQSDDFTMTITIEPYSGELKVQ